MAYTLNIYEKAMPAELSWRERLEAAGEAGFDAVEISIDESQPRLERLDWRREQRAQLLALTRETGVYLNTMCLSGHRKYPLGSGFPGVERRGMDIMDKAIGLASDIGVRIIQLAGYDVYYDEGSTPSTRERFLANLRRAAELAASRGVILALETMETGVPEKADFLNTVEKGMYYVREVGSPYLQMYPDTGNIYNAVPDVAKDLRTGRGHIAAAHLKETVPGVFRGRHFGDGQVDFAMVTDTLKDMGVAMYTAEFWHDPAYLDGDWRRAIREAHDFLRPFVPQA